VKILLDNVNINSSSGPNSFGKRLVLELQKKGHELSAREEKPDVQLSFIMTQHKRANLALRLDGIYFNSKQDWKNLNAPIKKTFDLADLVIYQSSFNKTLSETYFGAAKKSVIINNGTCLDSVAKIDSMKHEFLDKFSEIWCCASSWRPHKRLKDNINYFLEVAPESACLVVAGENPDYRIQHPRILFAGQLSWEQCIALYKRSKVFIHLAFLDHCPNVVVDARAAGCELIVASSGGTKEIAGINATIVEDLNWDMRPLDLYSPPPLNFSNTRKNEIDSTIDIVDISQRYIEALESIL